ncbi:hypothetical protein BDV96DRAFT_289558 [Lophiotrema nucula]|uniref:PWWP domain-containing protein n=1 Tax=Lophiotrema nucula TaxID=690887 RepID=A0A6A5YNF0_9PLEO|nr:hypothetical protein BDV96DRAFT_289558 [Lophiotrema nucula]
MATAGPGDYVLISSFIPDMPQWPAVVVTEGDIPVHLREGRPQIYNKPVLLMGHLKFHWAPVGDIHPLYDTQCPQEESRDRAKLERAYADVLDAWINDWQASHWINLRKQNQEINQSTPAKEQRRSMNEHEDELYARAIQASLDDLQTGKRARPPSVTPEDTAAKRRRPLELPRLHSSTSETGSPSRSPPKRRIDFHNNLRDIGFGGSSRSRSRTLGPDDGTVDSGGNSTAVTLSQRIRKTKESSSSLRQPKGHQSHFRAQINDSDDLATDEGWVEFRIGPERKPYFLRYELIQERSYFTGTNAHGLHCLLPKEGGGWIFDRPWLVDIKEEDFQFLAQFLENGDFGVIRVETDADRELAYAGCAAAWHVAATFGAEDMLEHIVAKFTSTMPWEEKEIFVFAKIVYRTDAVPLPAIDMMKDMLLDFIAAHYDNYLKNDATELAEFQRHSHDFQRDLLKRRLYMLDAGNEDDAREVVEEEAYKQANA